MFHAARFGTGCRCGLLTLEPKSMPMTLAKFQTPPSHLISVPLCVALAFAVQIAALAVIGRGWDGACRAVWQTGFSPDCNSQHLLDPYTWLHLGFGACLWVVFVTLRPLWRRKDILLLIAVSAVMWEVAENTPFVIGLFVYDGQATMAYSGDSIPNSVADTAAAFLGGLLASRVPRRAVLGAVVCIEAATSLAIDDGYLIGLLRVAGLL